MEHCFEPTIQAYNMYDEVYDSETAEFWEYFPSSTIDLFIKDLPGKNIINIGSGAGRDAVILNKRGLDVTCLDASYKMVKRTRKLGFRTLHQDFRNMEFNSNLYDGVWAYTSLLHVNKDDFKSVLYKIYSILKNNGIFLIGMIEGTFEGNKVSDSMPKSYRFFKYYEECELVDLIKQCGFEFKTQERYRPHNNTYLSQIYIKY